ncbi:MAG: hypothetical protein A2Y12_10335 [Planctomycetes bacterium GWF2_42_9]|nr:MAG: hypothetical protein A2Y12_10335 [Planctomycetes bacterium GWF2_42_9]
MELKGKDNFDHAMSRIYAWYENEMLDRPPVRFNSHNAFLYSRSQDLTNPDWKEFWFDCEMVVDHFIRSIENRRFLAETFPVFWPNLGPSVYAAFYGCSLEFNETTSWSEPCVDSWDDMNKLKLDCENECLKKIEELTRCAIEQCSGRFMVGYTDLHPGLDCVAAWRGSERMCMDLYDDPALIRQLACSATRDFQMVYDRFDAELKAHNQLSVSWLEIPSSGKMHIPSCDFGALISKDQYAEFGLPILRQEVQQMTHNIFHLDGPGVANHLESILSVPELNAIQWVQPPGDGQPIMQWVGLVKRIQAAKKSVVVCLAKEELEQFTEQMDPKGLFLCIAADDENEQKDIIARVEKW